MKTSSSQYISNNNNEAVGLDFDRFVQILGTVIDLPAKSIATNSVLIKWHANMSRLYVISAMKRMDLPNKSRASTDHRIIAQIYLDLIRKHISEIEKDLKENELNSRRSKELEIENNESDECGYNPLFRKSKNDTVQELIDEYERGVKVINESERLNEKKRKFSTV